MVFYSLIEQISCIVNGLMELKQGKIIFLLVGRKMDFIALCGANKSIS